MSGGVQPTACRSPGSAALEGAARQAQVLLCHLPGRKVGTARNSALGAFGSPLGLFLLACFLIHSVSSSPVLDTDPVLLVP